MHEITLTPYGRSFGDGRHPSTQGALRLLAGLEALKPASMLDIGCGSGILSLAALALWPECRITAGDLDPDAVQATRRNSEQAGYRLRAVRARGTDHPLIQAGAPYPLVVSNIIAEPLIALADALSAATAPGGRLILSGILVWREPLVLQAYHLSGLELQERLAIDEWRSLLLHKPAASG